MTKEICDEELKVTLTSSVIFDEVGQFIGGGILNTREHIGDEMWVQVMEDPVLDREIEEWGVTGRMQIHIGSTRRALEEFATFLLSLSHYQPPEPGYSAHFELADRRGRPALHLIVHLPVNELEDASSFTEAHTVATAKISKNGDVHDTTPEALQGDE
jgi:hypothetical protein